MLCKKIFDKIDELEKKLKTSQTTTNESDEEDDDFPISNMDDFDSVNLKLPNETTRKQLRIRLDSIGGKNVGDIVRKICVFCLNKKFARNFSWEGNRGNMCLKDTMLGKVMLGVILKYEKPKIKSHEAILAIQNWLRHAKDGMKAELAAAAKKRRRIKTMKKRMIPKKTEGHYHLRPLMMKIKIFSLFD
ncbi:uncharacterized protein LOC123472424 [Daphnia magna]|uniref:uncharacterized protein LOC123472424 n=1 Tax=Daphnia magna TaxID=35525 RepID=UPI001E1BB351|nr:uncharacterized protein LOC123472424 [Daphnia magna]